jgi:hypothetical protein
VALVAISLELFGHRRPLEVTLLRVWQPVP